MASIVPLHRLFHGAGGSDHFYTIDNAVANHVRHEPGWAYEGILGGVWDSASPNAVPFYVVYHNSEPGEHFYTTDVVERNRALEHGYIIEQQRGEVACWLYSRQVGGGDQPIYRMFNPFHWGGHFYTMDWNEAQYAEAHYAFQHEGIAGYCYPWSGPHS